MIHSVGLDVVDVTRIKRDIERFGDRLIRRILGEKEIIVYERRVDKEAFLAGRLAAKEAVIKGLAPFSTTRPAFNTLQIINDPIGRPRPTLPAEIQRKLGKARCMLSLTHEKTFAAAVAIFVED